MVPPPPSPHLSASIIVPRSYVNNLSFPLAKLSSDSVFSESSSISESKIFPNEELINSNTAGQDVLLECLIQYTVLCITAKFDFEIFVLKIT